MLVCESGKHIKIVEEDSYTSSKAIQPMICEGDIIGAVIMIARDESTKITDTELKMLGVAGNFLGKQMES